METTNQRVISKNPVQAPVKTPVKVQAEDPNSSFPTIIIDQNLGPRNNPDFNSLTFRWETKRKRSGSGILSIALGGNTTEKRHAIQSFHVDQIKELGLEIGDNLNEKLKAAGYPAVRIAVSEITESEFSNLEDGEQAGYSEKANPSTGEMLTHGGEQIYRKVFLADMEVGDDYLSSDRVSVNTTQESEADTDLPV